MNLFSRLFRVARSYANSIGVSRTLFYWLASLGTSCIVPKAGSVLVYAGATFGLDRWLTLRGARCAFLHILSGDRVAVITFAAS